LKGTDADWGFAGLVLGVLSYGGTQQVRSRVKCGALGVKCEEKCGESPCNLQTRTPRTSATMRTAYGLSVVVMIECNFHGEAPSWRKIQGW